MKSNILSTRATSEDARLLRFLAKQKGVTLSAYLLRAAYQAAKRDLEEMKLRVQPAEA